jgi:hypothetical protein
VFRAIHGNVLITWRIFRLRVSARAFLDRKLASAVLGWSNRCALYPGNYYSQSSAALIRNRSVADLEH